MESFCISRRSLTTVDLYEGLITLSELGALNVLRDRADIETGGWKTNAPALTTFCGGSLSVDQADRLLRSLDRKGYIKRWPTQKHEVYPYLIHGYYITDGMNKGKYLNAHKTTIGSIQYMRLNPWYKQKLIRRLIRRRTARSCLIRRMLRRLI